ncbi:MAG: SDR family NAD(P)-dependent oxidoreductase [Polyangiaceae bacterium]|nr:SDR family NAD(P)-dependent oxidoreductase [Polyangiaceae bacterium]
MALASNPRAVVTGGGSGIGRAFCLALAKRGARVLVADINAEAATQTAKDVRSAGGTAESLRCDVSKRDEMFALPDVMTKHFGGTDVIFNNAGVAVGGPVHEIPVDDWEWLMGINLWGVIYGTLAFLPHFRAQKSGHFVNVASAAGLICGPGLAPYNVAKAGVVALSESLSVEVAPDGIGVSVLCPTFIRTNIHTSSRSHGEGTREMGEKMMARAKKSADEIAEITLRSVDRGELYIVPHSDGLWGWRLKRADPEGFYKRIVPRAMKSVSEGKGSGEDGVLASLMNMIRK